MKNISVLHRELTKVQFVALDFYQNPVGGGVCRFSMYIHDDYIILYENNRFSVDMVEC